MPGTRADLIQFLEKLRDDPKGWVLGLFFHQISATLTGEKLKAVVENLKAFEKERLCRLFLSDQEAFLYVSENKPDDLKALLIKIRFLSGMQNTTRQEGESYAIYHLTQDFKKLVESLKGAVSKPSTPVLTAASSLTQVFQAHTDSMPFTPALLGQLERALQHADLSNITRRQPVCAIVGKSPPLELFEEIYVALSDLRKALCPNVDIYESPWLLGRLLETLDRRVLESIIHHDAGSFNKNFSLNLTVKTILGPDFQKFDETLNPSLKETVLLEIKQSDIFTDISAYLAARAFAASKGYRICIDTVTADSLIFLNREKLGADFIKLIWNQDLMVYAENKTFLQTLKQNDPTRVILCRIDDKVAVELGQAMGISLVQGYYIQTLLYQTPKAHTSR